MVCQIGQIKADQDTARAARNSHQSVASNYEGELKMRWSDQICALYRMAGRIA